MPQIVIQYLYNLVFKTDPSDISYVIVIGQHWLIKFAGLAGFQEKASNHERSVQFT